MPCSETPADHRRTLLKLARDSIAHGLRHDGPPRPDADAYPEALLEQRATFVTLHLQQRLRGCIGTLQAHRALVDDVAWNAHAAAFRDHRFGPLREAEFDPLHIEISILSPPEPFPVGSEEELLEQLRPGVDGLILEEGTRRATFLPAVWDSLPEPHEFVCQLKMKGGMPANYWSDRIRVQRYTAEKFGE